MTSVFFDVLGIVVAFVSVIALLSLIVTALVQMTQAVFGVRGKNLHHALSQLLLYVRNDDSENPDENAAKVLNAAPAAILSRNYSSNIWSRLRGPGVSWLQPSDLSYALDTAKIGLDPNQQETVEKGFAAIEPAVQKRLNRNMRATSIIWAVVVAFAYQVSTPHLISRLAMDSELRERYIAAAGDTSTQIDQSLSILQSYEDISARALAELEKQYPDLEPQIEEAGGLGGGRVELVQELRSVLGDHESADDVVAVYEQRLDELVEESRDVAIAEASKAAERLSMLGIEPWSDPTFYMRGRSIRWSNLIGVLITVILLSFGAPFWFKKLKLVVGLRDALKPEESTESKGKVVNP